MQVKIYSASNKYRLFDILKQGIKGYKEGFYLARLFVKRDLKAKYKTSYIGFIWEIIPSLTTAFVWIFLRGSGAINMADTIIPFPVFVIIGTIIWSLITESINKPLGTFMAQKSIITKISIPIESIMLIGFFNILINHGIKLILIILLLIFFQVSPSLSIVYFIPILLLTIVFFMCLGVFLLPIEFMLPDFARIKNYVFMALMYLTPVVYANPGEGVISKIMSLNPLTYFVEALRSCLTGMPIEQPHFFLGMIPITFFMFIGATVLYRVTAPIVVQRIGS